jgi:uncharacterized protein YndB with AHSA1/START domain
MNSPRESRVRTHLDDKPYESHYVYLETVIDHPVEKVWPHAVNIGSWMTDHRLETLAGEAGEVGHFERVYLRGLGEEVPTPHYHLYGTAAVVPNKCIVLEVFPEQGGSYGKTREWMMFDSILLVDLGSRTKMIFLMIDVNMGRAEQKEQHQDELARERLNRYFDNLKQLVQEGE